MEDIRFALEEEGQEEANIGARQDNAAIVLSKSIKAEHDGGVKAQSVEKHDSPFRRCTRSSLSVYVVLSYV